MKSSICYYSIFFFVWSAGCADMAADASRDEADAGADFNGLPVDFNASCGDVECDFLLVEGDRIVHGVPTWHPRDTGISLEGDPVVIRVTDAYAAHPLVEVDCYRLRVLGWWEEDVALYVDFRITYVEEQGDSDSLDTELPVPTGGVVSDSVRLTNRNWHLVDFAVKEPAGRAFMSFSVRKEGPGQAVLYYVEVDGMAECAGDERRID